MLAERSWVGIDTGFRGTDKLEAGESQGKKKKNQTILPFILCTTRLPGLRSRSHRFLASLKSFASWEAFCWFRLGLTEPKVSKTAQKR